MDNKICVQHREDAIPMCVERRFILIATLEIYANPNIVGIFNEASIKRVGLGCRVPPA